MRSAGIGALAAALITGVLGYFSMYQQSKAEDARAMKEQRRVAYSALITDERTLSRLELEFFQMVTDQQQPVTELTAQKQRIDEAYLKLSQDASNIALVGSPKATATAFDIEIVHNDINSGVLSATSVVANIGDYNTAQRYSDEVFSDSIIELLNELSVNFIEQGRRDLGALDGPIDFPFR